MEDVYRHACEVIPGGVSSPVRAFGSVGGTPVFLKAASGAHVVDIEDRRYVDLVCSWGPALLGHAHPEVVTAVQEAATRGLSFGAPTTAEVELAELIRARIPFADKVRFVSSGTEATMTAIRVARGATGRDVIVKFAGCYHGHSDALLAAAGSGVATQGMPGSAGVTRAAAGDTLVIDYNDTAALEQVFAERGSEIACVITEAAPANMGVIPPDPGFNAAIRRLTLEHGALMISDEVLTGFRVGPAGWWGIEASLGEAPVTPDLVTYGKVVGGGMPLAARGGPASLMDLLAPLGPVYQAGTLSGNPVAMAAGMASLRLASEDIYPVLEANADRLAGLISTALQREGVAHHIQRAATMLSIRFAEGPGHNFDEMKAADTFRFPAFFHALLDHGVYAPPSAFETWFVSTALTDDDFKRIEDALVPAAKAAAAATA